MIRSAKRDDLAELRRIASLTEMFLGDELNSFVTEMESHLDAVDNGLAPKGDLCIAIANDDERRGLGAIYFKPEIMAQGVMNLLFIGVAPEARQKGVGRALLLHFEDAVQKSGARLAIIETASDPMFAPAWQLYEKAGYEQEARVRDYFDDGLDKLIFRKRL